MFRYLLSLSLLLTAGYATGQGWERVYDGGGGGQINDLVKSPDGGYTMVGYYNNQNRAQLLKVDVDGKLQTSKNYFVGSLTTAEAVVFTQDQGYAIVGWYRSVTNPSQVFLIKTDQAGNQLWMKTYSSTYDAEGLDLVELPDGSLVISGHQKNLDGKEDVWVIKTNAAGTVQWSKTFGDPTDSEKGYAIALAPDGNLVIAGEKKGISPRDIYVLKVNSANGNLIWENTYGFYNIITGQPVDDVARDLVIANDGHIVVAGRSNLDQGGSGILVKIDGAGSSSILWQQFVLKADFYGLAKTGSGGYLVTGNKTSTSAQEELYIGRADADGDFTCDVLAGRPGVDRGYSIVPSGDGGAVAAGSGEFFLPGPISAENPYAVKMDKTCKVFTSYITGKIFHDISKNCTLDANEPGLEDWILKIESPNYTRFAAADNSGNFQILVDTGTYKIQLFPPNDYWNSCSQSLNLSVTAFSDTFSINIPAQSAFDCPRNEVDVATPILRRCADNEYTVRYCNSGTVPSENTQVVVDIDPDLAVLGSSVPWSNVQGNTYTFNVGTLNNGECGSFTIQTKLDCNTTISGQTHCVKAHIYPDTFCNIANWDRSIVSAEAKCENDSVKLILKNIGTGDMSGTVGFVITEDVLMLTAPGDPEYQIQLKSNKDSLIWQQQATGSTYRIIAGQTAGYPGLSYPTAAVEGCRPLGTSTFSTGFYTMFPEDDAEAFKASDCQESNDSDFNPDNLKRGHPKGYDVDHYVQPEADLEFLIQFQNSGTDTVHEVVIRDTLSPYLDPSTVHPGAASHAYDFDISGNGIVQFTLPNLNLLPGSSASEGYVKFRVSQKPELPCKTKIFNSAAIYFDLDAPVFTNQTFHTVCLIDTFAVVQTKNIEFDGADVKVYPNPFDESTTFEVTGVPSAGFRLELYNLQGQKVFNQSYTDSKFRLHRHHLPAGLFFYRLTTSKGKPVASGKLLVN
ncbi:MAG: T9SS type A sorting domain-containing protein [Saprospiraceae bacterium]|nr:T9SS type A sorting domain-containing protein [Saprospiraceae bacterium]